MLFEQDDDVRASVLNAAVGVLAYKDIDQTISNRTVLVNDEAIRWDVRAGAVYVMRASLVYESADIPDIKFGWSLPSGASMSWNGTGFSTGTVYQNFGNGDPSAGTTNFGNSQPGSPRVARCSGTITIGDEDGAVQLTWAQEQADAASTSVLAGSFGVLQRIA